MSETSSEVAEDRVARWLERTYGLAAPVGSRTRVSAAELEEEGEVVAALAREVAVATPVATLGDGFVATWSVHADVGGAWGNSGARPAVLYREVAGELVEAPSSSQAEALGELVAGLHVVGARMRRPSRAMSRRIDAVAMAQRALDHAAAPLRACGGDEGELRAIVAEMGAIVGRAGLPGGWVHGDLHLENVRFEGERPALFDFACAIVAEMGAIVGRAGLPGGWVHGDLHLENVRFEGERPALFDFACGGEGPFAYDLACYWRERVLAAEGVPEDWGAFVGGYGRGVGGRARGARRRPGAGVPARGLGDGAARVAGRGVGRGMVERAGELRGARGDDPRFAVIAREAWA